MWRNKKKGGEKPHRDEDRGSTKKPINEKQRR